MIKNLLDTHMQALTDAGYVRTASRPGPDERVVRRALLDAGYFDRDDLVEYLCWADYPEAGGSFLELFDYHSDPLSFEQAIAEGQLLRDVARSDEWSTEQQRALSLVPGAYPGPDHWIPIAMGVAAEMVLLDTSPGPELGGWIWSINPEVESFRAFKSLADAIQAATYCIQTGVWVIEDEGYSIGCPGRVSAPSREDLQAPPFSGYEAQPQS